VICVNMGSGSKSPRRRSSLRAPAIVVALAGSAFVGVIVGAWGVGRRGARNPEEVQTIVHDTAAVITAVRDLAILETASYHLERVIDLRDRQAHLFGLFESEDAVLLVAAVDVVAGIDLRSLRDGDISVDRARGRVVLLLPPPLVLSARVDNERTYVHTRTTSALAIPGKSLETRARQEAERTLREAAVTAGILARARGNAAQTLRALIQSLGFAEVDVRFREE
jgi:hypothetical protein